MLIFSRDSNIFSFIIFQLTVYLHIGSFWFQFLLIHILILLRFLCLHLKLFYGLHFIKRIIRFHKDNLRHHPRFPLKGLSNNRFFHRLSRPGVNSLLAHCLSLLLFYLFVFSFLQWAHEPGRRGLAFASVPSLSRSVGQDQSANSCWISRSASRHGLPFTALFFSVSWSATTFTDSVFTGAPYIRNHCYPVPAGKKLLHENLYLHWRANLP